MMKTYGLSTAKKLLKDWPYVACRYLPYYLPSYNTPKKGDIVLFYQLWQSTTSIGYNPVIPHGRG